MPIGKCLCEKIQVEIVDVPETFDVCHCLSCRRWTGGVFMSVLGGKISSFQMKSFWDDCFSNETKTVSKNGNGTCIKRLFGK